MADAKSRAETAASLRAEAHELLTSSGLFELLQRRFGDPSVTGSASYDLMVWRDIDIHLPIEATRWPEWMAFGGELAAHFESVGLGFHKATYINDYVDPHPLGAGLYWGLEFKDFSGNRWKVDIWGWDPFDYAVRQARDFTLKTDLGACDRDLILRLKSEARARDNYYGVKVSSWDIYQFAIKRAGDSLGALEAWKARTAT
ncbi:MAG TPA: hypothetical protein VG757_04545 [Devosia sp.]|nr:hypothetical protein [Devosia sp.]